MICFFAHVASLVLLILVEQSSGVKNLIGEPDYRQVRLQWESEGRSVPQNGYQIRYCELQSWGAQRCRVQRVTESDSGNSITEDGSKVFDTNVIGLRMATTYSFEIKAEKDAVGTREDRSDGVDEQSTIIIPTKGFSARATQCLPQTSVIEVSTGPSFAGRIAVESTEGERCAVDGEPTSQKDTYTLTINHTECGSRVNETTVATFVIVQENLPILTHSTRRFLVLCSFQPETLTVRAGISLPTRGHSQSVPVPEESADGSRRSRHLRPAKLLQSPEALVTKDEDEETKRTLRQTEKSIPIALLAIFMTIGLIGLLVAAIRCGSKRMAKELDNISIASSETSCGSCMTTTEVDIISETSVSPQKTRQQRTPDV